MMNEDKDEDEAENETLEDMDCTIEENCVNKEALKSTMAQSERNIPPHNVDAVTAHEAYPLNKIILAGEWSSLEDIYENLQEEAQVSWDDYPCFIRKRIKKLQDIKDEKEKMWLAGILSFINHLVKYKDLHSVNGVSSSKRHRFPSILNQRFSNLFGNTERLSTDQNDLLISYVLVLTLFADEFKTDRMNIARDLRIDTSDLKEHYERLGCVLEKEDGKWIFTLPVPLELPKVPNKKRGQ